MKLWRNRHLDNSLGKNIHTDTRRQTVPQGRGTAFLTTWGPWTVDDPTFDLWRVKRMREWENGVAKWEESIINQWVMGFRQCWPLLPALSVSQHSPNIQPESCYSFKHRKRRHFECKWMETSHSTYKAALVARRLVLKTNLVQGTVILREHIKGNINFPSFVYIGLLCKTRPKKSIL